MERVDSKEEGDESASPSRRGQAPENQEDQDGIGGMNEQAAEVVPPGVQTKYLAVQHVRQPGERVPVAHFRAAKGPLHARPGEASAHVAVVGDIEVVIVIDEVIAQSREEHPEHDQEQQNAQAQLKSPMGAGTTASRWGCWRVRPAPKLLSGFGPSLF